MVSRVNLCSLRRNSSESKPNSTVQRRHGSFEVDYDRILESNRIMLNWLRYEIQSIWSIILVMEEHVVTTQILGDPKFGL